MWGYLEVKVCACIVKVRNAKHLQERIITASSQITVQ
jgi:hypothetical protein